MSTTRTRRYTTTLMLRAEPAQRAAWQTAAETDGRSESDWARRALDRASRRSMTMTTSTITARPLDPQEGVSHE